MSDTPRTDAEGRATGFAKGYGFVSSEFARQLERDLRAWRAVGAAFFLAWVVAVALILDLLLRVLR